MGYRKLGSILENQSLVVIDNSIIMRWLVNDGSESDLQISRLVLDSIQQGKIVPVVPSLWVYESSHVIASYIKRGLLEPEIGKRRLEMPFEICRIIDIKPNPIELVELSLKYALSSYEATYLLLAHQLECSLSTLDKKLKKAVVRSKGKLLEL